MIAHPPPPHALENQSEYPRTTRYARQAEAIARAAASLNFGRLTLLFSHLDHEGSVGTMRVWSFAPDTVVLTRLYTGEAFLRQQPFYTLPHPSGLDDFARLRTPEAT